LGVGLSRHCAVSHLPEAYRARRPATVADWLVKIEKRANRLPNEAKDIEISGRKSLAAILWKIGGAAMSSHLLSGLPMALVPVVLGNTLPCFTLP
jgi:hypothetical protein